MEHPSSGAKCSAAEPVPDARGRREFSALGESLTTDPLGAYRWARAMLPTSISRSCRRYMHVPLSPSQT